MKLLLALFVLYIALLIVACATCDRGTGVNGADTSPKGAHDAVTFRPGVPPPVPHPHPTAASRSRTGAGRSGTGRLTDTTCYLATGHRTAAGLRPRAGMAASNRYPFGTRLLVETVGLVVVQDRIGYGSQLDLFFTSRPACLRFGRRQLHVEVLP